MTLLPMCRAAVVLKATRRQSLILGGTTRSAKMRSAAQDIHPLSHHALVADQPPCLLSIPQAQIQRCTRTSLHSCVASSECVSCSQLHLSSAAFAAEDGCLLSGLVHRLFASSHCETPLSDRSLTSLLISRTT